MARSEYAPARFHHAQITITVCVRADNLHAQSSRMNLAEQHGRVADTRRLRWGQHTRKTPGGLDCIRVLPCNTLQHKNDKQVLLD